MTSYCFFIILLCESDVSRVILQVQKIYRLWYFISQRQVILCG